MSEQYGVIEPYRRYGGQAIGLTLKKKAPAKWVSRYLGRQTMAVIFVLFWLVKLRLLGELSPFGMAFWVAAAEKEPEKKLLYAAGALAAAASTENLAYFLSLVLAMTFYHVLTERTATVLPAGIKAGLAFLAAGLPGLWLMNFHVYDIVLLGLEVVLVILSVSIFAQAMEKPSRFFLDREVETTVCKIVISGLVILAWVQHGGMPEMMAGGTARLIILWLSGLSGAGLAAGGGALLGFLAGIQGNALAWLSVLTFAGFLSGLFRSYGRVYQGMGFLLGAVSLSLYLGGGQAAYRELAMTVPAMLVFWLAPVLPAKLQALSGFIHHKETAGPEPPEDIAAARVRDFAMVFRELSEVFSQAAARETRREAPLALIARATRNRVCEDCLLARRCWERDPRRTHSAILRVLDDLNNGKNFRDIRMPDFFSRNCRHKEEFLYTLCFVKEMLDLNQNWQRKLAQAGNVVALQFSGLSQIMLELCADMQDGTALRPTRHGRQHFHVELGIAQAPKGAENVCGDYYSYLELRDGRQAYILSDGMGNGREALAESRSTVSLVEQLLLAGFRQEVIIRTVNTVLQLRSDRETFSTLDVMILDTQLGHAEFFKVGAAPSFLINDNGVEEIRSPSLPLGILDEVEMKPVKADLGDDTLLVMVTDGIYDMASGSPDWLKEYLEKTDLNHPQVLADEILHRARERADQRQLKDDVTVLVCRCRRLKNKTRAFRPA